MKYVIYELVGGWARVTLNRPEKRNALSAALLDELASVLWEADEDRVEFWHDLETGYGGRERL